MALHELKLDSDHRVLSKADKPHMFAATSDVGVVREVHHRPSAISKGDKYIGRDCIDESLDG